VIIKFKHPSEDAVKVSLSGTRIVCVGAARHRKLDIEGFIKQGFLCVGLQPTRTRPRL